MAPGALFVRRRGVPLPEYAKRALRLSFVLSFLLVLILLHLEDKGVAIYRDVHLVPIGISTAWATPLFGSAGSMLARSQRISNRKLKEACNFRPRYPSVREGFRALAAVPIGDHAFV